MTNVINDSTLVHSVVYDTAVPKLLSLPADSTEETQADTCDYLMLCNDSVFAPYAADSVTVYRESMFATNRQTATGHESPMRDSIQGFDWMFFIILALLALTSVYLNHMRFGLKDIFLSLFNQRVQERVERENNVKILSLLPMTGIYFASVAAIVTRLVTSHHSIRLTVEEPLFYALLVVAIYILILLRGTLARLIGNIFDDSSNVLQYLTINHLFYFVGGVVLTPFLLFVYFAGPAAPTALVIASAFIAILFVMRFIRGIQLFLTNSKKTKLYLFYYLCILEIVPILAMAKIIIK